MESTFGSSAAGFDKRNHRVERIKWMVQQHVVPAQFFEQIMRFRGQVAVPAEQTA